jgi:hypothetical protein
LTGVPVLHHPGPVDLFVAPAQPVAETRQIKIPFKVIILAGRQHQRRDGLASDRPQEHDALPVDRPEDWLEDNFAGQLGQEPRQHQEIFALSLRWSPGNDGRSGRH